MLNLTTTASVQDLDCTPLGRIGRAYYFEVHSIVKEENGRRESIGRASDWPVIEARARAAQLEQLLIEAECHIAELIDERDTLLARQGAYDDEIATLRAAVLVPAPVEPIEQAPAQSNRERVAASDDGLIACDWPGCEDRMKPRGLAPHKRKKHGVVGPIGHKPSKKVDDSPWQCAECGATTGQAIGDPTRCKSCLRTSMPAVVAPGDLAELAWRCADCGTSTHTRSVSDPTKCLRCAADALSSHKNGHQVAA